MTSLTSGVSLQGLSPYTGSPQSGARAVSQEEMKKSLAALGHQAPKPVEADALRASLEAQRAEKVQTLFRVNGKVVAMQMAGGSSTYETGAPGPLASAVMGQGLQGTAHTLAMADAMERDLRSQYGDTLERVNYSDGRAPSLQDLVAAGEVQRTSPTEADLQALLSEFNRPTAWMANFF